MALALPVAGRTPPERANDALVFLCNTNRRWLLVFDNAAGPGALRGLPNSGNGRVLVTSRHRGGYDTFGTEVPVDVFDTPTARRYLLSRTGRTEQEADDADAVAIALGCLPLALAHAGAYCSAGVGVPFRDYLELLEGLPSQELFKARHETFYLNTVAATWNASIVAAEKDEPLARRVLQMAAYLAPDAIPRSFFSVLGDSVLAERKRVADALAAVHRYSLAIVTDSYVNVHRLLQKVIRDQLTAQERADATAHALAAIKAAMPDDYEVPSTWPQWQTLYPHVMALSRAEGVDENVAPLMAILNPTCKFLLEAGLPHSAEELAARAVSAATSRLGVEHDSTLTARMNLAIADRDSGRISEAVALAESVVTDSERIRGIDHPDTLSARQELASSYWRAGRTDQAIALEERVAADSERILGSANFFTLSAQGNLAVSYLTAGRTDEAIALAEQVVICYEHLVGPDHPDTLTSLGNLAAAYQAGERSIETIIAIKERVVAGSESLLGPDHPDTLAAKGNLAFSYRKTGRVADAVALDEKVVEDSERLFGPEHPDTLHARGNLADSYRSVGRADEAIAILEPLITDLERVLGPEHVHTLLARSSLAASYRSVQRTEEALGILGHLITDCERALGSDHRYTLTAKADLASVRAEVRQEERGPGSGRNKLSGR